MTDIAQGEEFLARCAALGERLQTLPDKPEETVAATLRTLWHLAAGNALSVEAALRTALSPLDSAAATRLNTLIDQRLTGIPLAHLSGRQHFMGLEMLAGKDALIPRAETELLGGAALALLREMATAQGRVTVVDVCTGSGNLALALAHHEPKARVFAADLSAEAVGLAGRNAAHLGLQERVELRCGDLLEPFNQPQFHGQVDLLVCNPPYISSQRVDTMSGEISGYEPRLAFDGGPLGVRIVQRLIREAPTYLTSGGWLAFEVGLGQGPAVMKRLSASGSFAQQKGVADADGQIRVLLASK